MATGSESDSNWNGWGLALGFVVKAAVLIGGTILIKRLTKSNTRWDHTRIVADSLSGEKFSREQASRDPDNFFNIRMLTCPATEMVDDSKVLYFEQAFWRTPQKPFRQVSSYAIREVEEYKNFCDRPRDQRPLPEEVIGDIGEHLTTIYLRRCDCGKHCLYKGTTPPGGFPNSWVGIPTNHHSVYCFPNLSSVHIRPGCGILKLFAFHVALSYPPLLLW